jgi:two-component system sensor histidine kinase KdpD
MVLSSRDTEPGTVEAIAGLVALALERARFLKEVSVAEALRQSDELKSALLASVSHDLRTPLTSIRAAIDSLLEESISWDRTALREFHLIISEEVNRLTRLVQNLLEMARIEAGELKLSKQWGAISEIINTILIRCDSSLRGHIVKVELEENQALAKIDSRLIAEALANLVENAAKYSSPGSEIAIRGRAETGEMIISVSDHGMGVAPGEIERVFDKFYRGVRLSGNQTQGTGMGLSIAKGIIEAHGGRIWVDSRFGHGATFSFAIPVEWKSAAANSLTADSA